MEDHGYAWLGFAVMFAVPAGLYWAYFNQPRASAMVEVSAPLVATRAVDEIDGKRDRRTYFEVTLEGFAVPLRVHRPVFDPRDAAAPFDGGAFDAAPGTPLTAHILAEDRGYLKKAPFSPPHRWVEAYSLASGGRRFLELDAALTAWAADRKLALYLANAFVLVYVLVLGFFFVDAGRPTAPPRRYPPVDRDKAALASSLYYLLIPGLLFGNLPSLAVPGVNAWTWGVGYWATFVVFIAALQALFWLHHRRYLSIMDSRPRAQTEAPGGFLAYLTLTVALAFMLTPLIQALYWTLVSAGGAG